MKRHAFLLIGSFFLISVLFCLPVFAVDLNLSAPTKVYFGPDGGAGQAILKEINEAKSEILIQAYPFTSAPILKAFSDALKRGVKVEAILDKSQRRKGRSAATSLTGMKIPAYIDSRHAIAQNKVMIIDKTTVITGSSNFARADDEKNAETLLIIKSKDLARLYLGNWSEHRGHSEDYQRKQVSQRTAAPKKKP